MANLLRNELISATKCSDDRRTKRSGQSLRNLQLTKYSDQFVRSTFSK